MSTKNQLTNFSKFYRNFNVQYFANMNHFNPESMHPLMSLFPVNQITILLESDSPKNLYFRGVIVYPGLPK